MKLRNPTLTSLAVTLLLAAATVQSGEMATKEKMSEGKAMAMEQSDTMAKEGMMTKDDSMAKEGMAKEETMGKEGMMKEEMGQPMGGDKMDKKM